MSYLAKKQRSFLMRCYLHCQNLVMISLIFSLMLLLTALGLSIYYEELPVPDKLIRKLQAEFEKQGLNLDFETIALDFRGNVFIKSARVAFTDLEGPALDVGSLYLDINYAALFIGKPPFDLLRLGSTSFYSPPVVSRSGATETLVSDVNLELTRKWSTWNLNYLTGRFKTLNLSAHGDLSALVAKLSQPKEKKEDRPELYIQYLQLSRFLSDYSKNLQGAVSPRANFRLSSEGKGTFVVEATLMADAFSYEGLPTITEASQQSLIQVFPEIQMRGPIQIKATSVEDTVNQLSASDLTLSVWKDTPILNLDTLFPFEADITTGPIEIQGTAVDHLIFKGQLLSQNSAEGRLVTSLYGGSLEADLTGDWKEKTAAGTLTGSLNLEEVFARPEFDHLWKLRWSKQYKPLYVDLNFNYPDNLDEATAQFRVETRDIDIIKTPFKWAQARGTLEGTKADVYRLEGGGYGNDLLCSFRQDLRSPFYHFSMVGRFRPHDIDVWWRDWWKKTFDYLDIKGELPWMDLSLRNAFKFKKQLTLFGYAEAENINLKGMHFDRASSKMFIRPNYIDALDLELERPEGNATGGFQRQLVFSKLKNVIVDVESNIELEPSFSLFGESGLRILEPYTWDGNPNISVKGEFNFENDTHWQDIDFSIQTDQGMTLYDFPFDSLDVQGRYQRGDTLLDDVQFGFAGGNGWGEASFLRQEEQSFLIFDFDIENADLDESLQRIASVKEIEEEEETAPSNEKDQEPLEGKLQIHVNGISPAGYGLDRVMAKGEIEITEGNLAQIPLFGPLSGLLPFTKLQLNEAKSYFAWDDGKMTFPDLVLTGKTGRLEGVGDYHTSSSLLDFQVQMYLLRETDIPLVSDIIMPLFDPVSHMASVNLKGTLKKPEWRFAISPLNLFDSKPEEIKEEPKEELQDFEFRK